jgi:1,2-diacylglycerol 3-alpha-glucosyltransferase
VDAIPTARLLILGSGPEEETIRQQVAQLNLEKQITLAGMVPYDELPRYLAMCDIFVTASVTEVHPLSVIEAMASGLPVVGVQSVGVGDTVEDGFTGYLARNDVASYTAKLTRLCLEKTLQKKMGATARNSAKKYAIERTSAIMLEHYERLITGAHSKQRGIRYKIRSFLERYRG